MHSRRAVRIGVLVVVLALAGGVIAAGLESALGIRTEEKSVPVERPEATGPAPVALPPTLESVEAPDDARVSLAVDTLRDAVDAAPETRGSVRLRVRHGAGPEADDSYTLRTADGTVRLMAPSRAGGVRGVYELAQAVREARPIGALTGDHPPSDLPFRMVDLGAAGVTPDPEEWRGGDDYSHVSGAFTDVMLPEAPYVDHDALADAAASVEEYVEHVLAEGYNAIAVPGFLEYVTFDGVDGVYETGDEHVARAEAMRDAFGPIWQRAHDLGLKVYFKTDMLALTTPLERYFEERFGGLDTENPELWDLYAAGLDEIYASMPYVDGVMIRIGEAGDVYDTPGMDYSSKLAVTSVDAVRSMLTAFTEQAERAEREVIFRTWSVGVGAVGDLHTNPESYDEVLGGIESDRLVISTKYSLGDFYSHLPLNHTLEIGDHRRIVELQSRREFEGSGALPNDLGDLYRQALRHFTEANPRVEGVWTWTQDGGPWRAGPMSLELTTGFWQLYELNTVLAARLARDVDADVAAVTAGWARRWFSHDPETVRAIVEAMALSRSAITEGLYVGPYAEQLVYALGLEPPPMMWIFEWDIVTGDSAVLSVMYAVGRDRVDEAIAEGAAAADTARRMRDLVAGTDPVTWHDPALRDHFADALDFQVDLLELLAAYRTMVLHHAEWLDGDGDARDAWAAARDEFVVLADEHERRWGDDLDFPAWNLTAAEIGLERAERDLPMAWLARIALVLLLGWMLLGITDRSRAARATWLAGTRPWRATDAVAGLSRRDRFLVVAVPLIGLVVSRLAFTWFAAPAQLLVSALGWVGLALGLAIAVRRHDPWPVVAAVGGAVVLRVVLLLAVLAPRGPGGYWFAFWTSPERRTAYVVVSFVLFCWVLVAAAWALRSALGRRRAVATIVATVGGTLAAGGALVGTIGLEDALTLWNDQMALLPWGLSRILGITVHLGIPTALPWWAAAAGAALSLGRARRCDPPPSRHATPDLTRAAAARSHSVRIRSCNSWSMLAPSGAAALRNVTVCSVPVQRNGGA